MLTQNAGQMQRQRERQGQGNIANTSSISGLIWHAGDIPYNVNKHGIIGLTKAAVLENLRSKWSYKYIKYIKKLLIC